MSALAEDYRIRTHGPVSDRRRINNEDLRNAPSYNSSWCTQFWWLFKRSFLKTLRDPLMVKVRLLHTLLTAAFISIVFFNTKITRDTLINADGLLYNVNCVWVSMVDFQIQVVRDSYFMYVTPCILVFTEELPGKPPN